MWWSFRKTCWRYATGVASSRFQRLFKVSVCLVEVCFSVVLVFVVVVVFVTAMWPFKICMIHRYQTCFLHIISGMRRPCGVG